MASGTPKHQLGGSYEGPLRNSAPTPGALGGGPRRPGRSRGPILVGLLLIAALLVGGAGWTSWQMRGLPDPGQETVLARSITVYDRNGHVLAERDPQGRFHVVLTLAQMGALVPAATLAAEDRDFYKHGPIDPPAVIRALGVDLATGHAAEGGSTITQQLVKIELLGSQKTFTRKAQELLLAYSLEHRYSKDQILAMYLNRVYYGHGAYGVGSAAKTYFGADHGAANLTVAQAAFLAGLLQAPSAYDPFLHYDRARVRQLYVLKGMVRTGAITETQEQRAEQENIQSELKLDLSYRKSVAPHFVDWVIGSLEEQLGAATVHQGGLAVYTTLDPQLQQLGEGAVSAGVGKLSATGVNNGMLLAARPSTGEILAWVGSADYGNNDIGGQYDVVLSPRQPGSSFKPYVYEAALLSRKWTVDSPVHDSPASYGAYTPQDYDNRYQGTLCLKTALDRSRNVPAVEVANKVGMTAVNDLAARMGIRTKLEPSLQTALGGSAVTMFDHVQGYQVFANGGAKVPLVGVLKVLDRNGNSVFQVDPGKPASTQVMSPAEAYLMTYMLKDYQKVWNFPWNRQMAAKTGTTGASIQQPTDAWVMAYNPDIVLGTWVGHTGADGKGGTITSYGEAVASNLTAQFVNGLPAGYGDWYQRPAQGLVLSRQTGDPLLPGTESLPSCGSGGAGAGGGETKHGNGNGNGGGEGGGGEGD
ncbi:MAG: penicillin-binding protein 1A [Candidatus Dormibacteraceae bacterium]